MHLTDSRFTSALLSDNLEQETYRLGQITMHTQTLTLNDSLTLILTLYPDHTVTYVMQARLAYCNKKCRCL